MRTAYTVEQPGGIGCRLGDKDLIVNEDYVFAAVARICIKLSEESVSVFPLFHLATFSLAGAPAACQGYLDTRVLRPDRIWQEHENEEERSFSPR